MLVARTPIASQHCSMADAGQGLAGPLPEANGHGKVSEPVGELSQNDIDIKRVERVYRSVKSGNH